MALVRAVIATFRDACERADTATDGADGDALEHANTPADGDALERTIKAAGSHQPTHVTMRFSWEG